jgi:hypothetical protein
MSSTPSVFHFQPKVERSPFRRGPARVLPFKTRARRFAEAWARWNMARIEHRERQSAQKDVIVTNSTPLAE